MLCFGYISIVQAQTYSKNPNSTTIGKTYKKIDEISVFKKYKEEEGLVIIDSKGHENLFSKISDGTQTLVLFTKYSPNGYTILAILELGKIENNCRVIMRDCRLNAKTDGFIVAIVGLKPWKAYFTNVIKAWKVDQKTNMFISIPTKGIDCLNEEFENIN